MLKQALLAMGTVLTLCSQSGYAADNAFRFFVTGDTRGSDNGVNAEILAEMANAAIAEGAEVAVVTGDLVTNGYQTQLETWVSTFMAPLQGAGIMVLPCRGNHDGDINAWRTVFSGSYELPGNGPAGEEKLTYSVAYKNALFISTEQYLTILPEINQPWLDDQLAANTLPHIFVFGHTPAFSVYHTDCLAVLRAKREAFWNSLGLAGGSAYFCGHDHFYDHARVEDANGNWLHQYVCGAGGAPLYNWDGTYGEERVEGVSHFKNYGYLVVDIDNYLVTMTLKERTAPGVYTPTGDVYSYISPVVLPAAAFIADVTVIDDGDTVQFTDESTPGLAAITSWVWDFGDGQTSTQQSPAHVYAAPGDYTVSLTVTNSYGPDTVTKTAYVAVGMPAANTLGLALLMALMAALVSLRGFLCRA